MIVQVSVVLNRTVVVTVNNNSFILDYVYLDDHTHPTYEMTPGFKPFINTLFKSLVDVKKKKNSPKHCTIYLTLHFFNTFIQKL